MQEMTGFWGGSGISWTTCKQSAPRSRQKTTPTPHHSIFTGQMLFPKPNQQCQSTEGRRFSKHKFQIFPILYNGILRAYSEITPNHISPRAVCKLTSIQTSAPTYSLPATSSGAAYAGLPQHVNR